MNYIDYSKQVFNSFKKYNKYDCDLMLFGCDLTQEVIEHYQKNNILVKNIPRKELEGFGRSSSWSNVIYMKYYLFHKDMKKWDQIVFCETDTLVRKDIRKLFDVKGIFATPNNGDIKNHFENIKGSKEHELLFEELNNNYNINAGAFNAGAFFFNTDIINDTTFDELIDLSKKYSLIATYPEQSILSLYWNNWKKISMLYHYLGNSRYFDKTNIDKVYIIHALCKPWKETSVYHSMWKENYRELEVT
jgi:hypothetical protein